MAYFPNGTSGEMLDDQCDECPLGKAACPIFLVQMLHNYDQCSNEKLKDAMNLLINEKGICQMRPMLLRAGVKTPEEMEPPKPILMMSAMKEWAKARGLQVA